MGKVIHGIRSMGADDMVVSFLFGGFAGLLVLFMGIAAINAHMPDEWPPLFILVALCPAIFTMFYVIRKTYFYHG